MGEPDVSAEPDWGFDTDGDTEGWAPLFGLDGFDVIGGSLVMDAAADPHFGISGLALTADFDTLNIRMRISDGGSSRGQVFFSTDSQPEFTEADSVLFNVRTDGEFHDYSLDMSAEPGWTGVVDALRIDPLFDGPATIEVDRIWLEAG